MLSLSGIIMKKAVIIKTGDTYPEISSRLNDFEAWIIAGLKIKPELLDVIDLPRGGRLPEPSGLGGVVIAGSHAMVTQDLEWSLKVERWLPKVVKADVPVLGICYGHQLLARAMGGAVAYHEQGIEIGTTVIECSGQCGSDLLFKGVPERFEVHACHSQTVVKLPENAVLLAKNDFEPHHAFRIGPCAWGVQFHPEYNRTIMKAYVQSMQKQIEASGQDMAAVLSSIRPTPVAAEILERFGRLMDH
jgi:GMP synthase (glutamine-hydrolysing)